MTQFMNQKRQRDIDNKAIRDARAAGEDVEAPEPPVPGFVQSETSREPLLAITEEEAEETADDDDDDAPVAKKAAKRPAKKAAKPKKAAKKR